MPNLKGPKIQWRKRSALGITKNTGHKRRDKTFPKENMLATYKRPRIENVSGLFFFFLNNWEAFLTASRSKEIINLHLQNSEGKQFST